jgi:hypothetical protein
MSLVAGKMHGANLTTLAKVLGAVNKAPIIYNVNGQPWHVVDPTGLVFWLRMDENTGTTCADLSGNGNTANFTTSNPSYNPSWETGKIRYGVGCNASDNFYNYLLLADHASLDVTTAMTIALWAYRRSNTAADWEAYMHRQYSTGSQDLWGIWFAGASPSVQYAFGLRTDTTGFAFNQYTTGVADLNTWVHLAMTFDPADSKRRDYYNGSLVYTSSAYSGNITTDSRGVSLCAGNNGNPNYAEHLNAIVDDARMYSRCLTTAEIAKLAGV